MSPLLGGRLEIDFLAGLIAGFASSLHCLAMCSGVVAAIGASAIRSDDGAAIFTRQIGVLAQAQLARVGLYVALGGVAGGLGWGLNDLPLAGDLHALVRWSAALVLLLAAYTVADIKLFGGAAGRLGAQIASPVFRHLHRLHRFGPLGLGLAWGLMPCAMVYLTTFYAGLTGSVIDGGLVMLGFGLGTIPALTVVGLTTGGVTALASNPWLRTLAALALLGLSILTMIGAG